MPGIYGIIGLKIECFKDDYKDADSMYKNNFKMFMFYDYFKELKNFNKCFNLSMLVICYMLMGLSFIIIGGIGEVFLTCSLLVLLIKLIESIIYLKFMEFRTSNVYKNGYYVTGYGIKDDKSCIIKFITLDVNNLHLKLEKELELVFNCKN